MVEVSKTPWAAFLLHVGACTEAIDWAGRRNISRAEFDSCPHASWRAWLRKALSLGVGAQWNLIEPAMAAAMSGSGSGDGYGDGDGYGSGYGYGYGSGYGSGYGYGYGDDVVS